MLLLTLKPIIAEQHGSPREKTMWPHEGKKKKKCGLVTKHAVEELYKKKKKKISLFKLMQRKSAKSQTISRKQNLK